MQYCSRIFYMICLLMCINIAADAQKKITGIYSTMDDYLSGRLSYTKDNGNKAPRLHLYTLAPKSHVTLQHNGKEIHINKNEIFAYQLTNGDVYRVEGNHSYQILNKNPQLLLYKRKIPTSPKAGPEDQYKTYFSASNGKIQTLTAWNVKQAFPAHETLADKMDALFKRDAELLTYDRFRGMYKLEWLVK